MKFFLTKKDHRGGKLFCGLDYHLGYPFWFSRKSDAYFFPDKITAQKFMDDEPFENWDSVSIEN